MMIRRFWNRLRARRGQGVTEYMLVISVIAIAVVAATYDPIANAFSDGSDQWKSKVTDASSKGGFGATNQR